MYLPLGWNESEANELSMAAQEAGVILMVGFMKKYALKKLRKVSTQGDGTHKRIIVRIKMEYLLLEHGRLEEFPF